MRKLLLAVLIFALTALTFASCGGDNSKLPQNPPADPSPETTAIPFIWQNEEIITPGPELIDIDIDNLAFAFTAMDDSGDGISDGDVYFSPDADGLYEFYLYKDNELFSLFEIPSSDTITFEFLIKDMVTFEIVAPVNNGTGEYGNSLDDVMIYRYIDNCLYSLSVRDALGCDIVYFSDDNKQFEAREDAMTGPSYLDTYAVVPGSAEGTGYNGCGFVKVVPGEADRLGSWGGISSEITRGTDWKQYVTDSAFKLGDFYLRGYWGPDNDDPYYGIRLGTYPKIDGSTVCVPLGVEFARQHLGMTDEQANAFTFFNMTDGAYYGLIHRIGDYSVGMVDIDLSKHPEMKTSSSSRALVDDTHPADIILVTYPNQEELGWAKNAGEPLKIEPICYDAFVFITHKDNPVESLTLEQLRDIYSGKIKNWKELGGEDAPIIAYQREQGSGSQSGMEQLVMQGTPMLPAPEIQVVDAMAGLVDAVAEYQNGSASIGYTYKYYIDVLYKNEDIKILKIDGAAPDAESLRDAAYPLTVSYYGVVRENDGSSSVGHRFLDWILSAEGQKCVAQAGYISLVP